LESDNFVLNELYAKYQSWEKDRAPSQSEELIVRWLAANGPISVALTYISHFRFRWALAEGDAASPSAPQQGAVRRKACPSIS